MRPDRGAFPWVAAQLLARLADAGAADGRAAAAAPGARADALRRRAAALLAASDGGDAARFMIPQSSDLEPRK